MTDADRFLLDTDERRVIGVLIEKSLTTPQYYPLTINAIVTGSNQKSNRDPHVEFVDDEVAEILARLQKRGLASEHYGAGGRTARWRQEFTKELALEGKQMAVLAELLLRGPQMVGELRTRASRMKEIPDQSALDAVLASLEAMVPSRLVRLTPPEQKRGARVTHGFYPPAELARVRAAEPAGAVEAPSRPSAAMTAPYSSPAAALRPSAPITPPSAPAIPAVDPEVVEELRAEVAALARRVAFLEEQLGIPSG